MLTFTNVFIFVILESKIKVPRDIRISRSENMTSSGETGLTFEHMQVKNGMETIQKQMTCKG